MNGEDEAVMRRNIDLGQQLSLKQLVYNTLHDMIIRGELHPGERITEEDLAQSMNISRAPIREGLNMLERDGFVAIIPRKGAIVTRIDQNMVRDLWEARLVIEPYSAVSAMDRIPEEEALALKAELEDILSGTIDTQRYIDSDIATHELIYKYMPNAMLKGFLENLQQHSLRVRWIKEQRRTSEEEVISSTKEHLEIVNAILAHDADRLKNVFEEHVRHACDRVGQYIE